MKVLHLSTFDVGGAGKAALRLHRNLVSRGLDSRMLVLTKRSSDPLVFQIIGRFHPYRAEYLLAKAMLKARSDPDFYFQNQSGSPVKSPGDVCTKAGFTPDLVVVHWVSNFLSFGGLRRLYEHTGAPLVWHLMDMAPFTGGCHYAWDCLGYTRGCGRCPALRSDDERDLSFRILDGKKRGALRMEVTVVAPTSWLAAQARKSALFGHRRIERIMLGVDPDVFRPLPREAAKSSLGIPPDRKVVLFGSQSLATRRKGMSYLYDAFRYLADRRDFDFREVLAISVGDSREIREFLPGAVHHRALGFLPADDLLAKAYQAADLFVCPSIEDSGPMMVNEAIMCGTPVVSFEMGVAIDLVQTGQTGYRAELRNSEDLANGIRYVLGLSREETGRMSERCRQLGMERCDPKAQADSFCRLFDSLRQGRAGPS